MTIGVVESNKTPPGARVCQDIARVRRFEGVESDRTIDGGPYLGDTLSRVKYFLSVGLRPEPHAGLTTNDIRRDRWIYTSIGTAR